MADTEFDVNIVVNESVNPDVGETEYEGGLSIDDNVLSLSAESSEDTIVDAEVSTTEVVDVEISEGTGTTSDHRKLYHRDEPNQHPISAITGLTSSIETLQSQITGGITEAYARIAAVSGVASLAKNYDIQEFAASESNTTAPEEGWSTEAPELSIANPYLWQRIATYEKVSSGSDIFKSATTPTLATTMSGLYVFMKNANDGTATVINGGAIVANTLDIQQLNVSSRNTIANKAENTDLQNEIETRTTITDALDVTVTDQGDNLTSINTKVQIDQGGTANVNLRTGDSSVSVSNGRISFMDNGNEVAYIDSNGLQITNEYVTYMFPRVNVNGTVTGSLGWIARSNGHLTLKKVRGGV